MDVEHTKKIGKPSLTPLALGWLKRALCVPNRDVLASIRGIQTTVFPLPKAKEARILIV
jgi:hypothetical protein